MTCLEQSSSWQQKIEWWPLGTGGAPGNGELLLTEYRVSAWNDKTFLELVIGDS